MLQAPPIVLTRIDHERLRRLLTAPTLRGRVDALEEEIDRADVVEPTQLPPDVVSMNSTVRLRELGSGREYELTLVYPGDADGETRVSVLAPIGTALLGLSVGTTIDWPLPSGQTARILALAVTYQPEAAGLDLH